MAAGLAALVLLAFAGSPSNGFVSWDDRQYLLENAAVGGGLTLSSVRWAFTTFHASNWHPLTWLSHLADVTMFSLEPAGHHAVSLLLHAAAAASLFLVLRAMTGSLPRSAAAAALLALHPLRVESVAWAAERKDVLSFLLAVLTLGGYLSWLRRPTARRYWLVAAPLAAGLLAKPTAVTLPLALLLLDWWPLGRWESSRIRRLALEKVPLLFLSAASAAVTIAAQTRGGAVKSLTAYPAGVRLANAVVSVARYLGKTIWPADLAFFYPHPRSWPAPQVMLAAALLAGVTLAAVLWRRRPFLAVGWSWFLLTLLPVSGIVQVGEGSMADRYTYLPHLGLALLACWGLPALAPGRRSAAWLAGAAAVSLLLLANATRLQVRHWRDGFTLMNHALEVTDANWQAHFGLGDLFMARGDLDAAIGQYRLALEIKPYRSGIHNNLGKALVLAGREREGLDSIRRALALDPESAGSWYNLGTVHLARGDPGGAAEAFRRSLALEPSRAETWNNLGVALARQGGLEEAARCYRRALQIDPRHEMARRNLEELGALAR